VILHLDIATVFLVAIMERYDFRPRPTQTPTTEATFTEGSAQGQVAEDPGLTTPELVVGPQDSTTSAWIGGYPEGSQAGPVPVSTSGLGSGPTLANVAFLDSILLKECAPDLRAEAEPDWDMEIREECLSYQTSPPQLMPPTGISTSGVSTDFSLGSSTLDTSAAGLKQDNTQQTENRDPSI